MLGGTLSTSPAQFTTIVASMFVNKTKTTLRAHGQDRILVQCAEVNGDFGPTARPGSIFIYIP